MSLPNTAEPSTGTALTRFGQIAGRVTVMVLTAGKREKIFF